MIRYENFGDSLSILNKIDEFSLYFSDVTLLQLAVTSSLISWLHVIYQFQQSIHHTLVKYDEWLDLCMCKALSEALDLRDDLVKISYFVI